MDLPKNIRRRFDYHLKVIAGDGNFGVINRELNSIAACQI